MHTICGMCGVFSYLLCSPRGNMNSGCLECTFLAIFSMNLNMLYPLYVVVWIKKALNIPMEWNKQGSERTSYVSLVTSIIAWSDLDFKCTFKKLISNLTLSMCMYAYINI